MKGIPLWPVGRGLGVCSKGVLKQLKQPYIDHGQQNKEQRLSHVLFSFRPPHLSRAGEMPDITAPVHET